MRLAGLAFLTFVSSASAQEIVRYEGLCEASAGAFLDATHFAVASDEADVLRLYERGKPALVASVPLEAFTGHDKSDIEGASRRGDVIYWSASQSNNSSGKDKKRRIVFATRIETVGGKTTLKPFGVVREDLKAEIVRLSGASAETINVEGLAATPDGGLLFGQRNLVDGKAAVVHLRNADAVLADKAVAPVFAETAKLDLGGRGIRSLEFVDGRYLVVAGRAKDEKDVGFALFWWSGVSGEQPTEWTEQPSFADFDPEVVMPIPGERAVLSASDDGDRCPKVDREDPPLPSRRFPGFVLPY